MGNANDYLGTYLSKTRYAEWYCPVIFRIEIADNEERVKFAQEVQNIVKDYKTYIPGRNRIVKCDMGISANINLDTFTRVQALIDRRGYRFTKAEEPE